MTEAAAQRLGVMAKSVIIIVILLIVAEVVWHGVTLENAQRLWRNLVERPSGPMWFRFILQPIMAAIAAVVAGLNDARTGRSPYFLTVLFKPDERVARLREGLNATARILLLGLVMDVIYQLIVLHTFYPFEAVNVAFLLAFVPYFLIRGPAMRIARRWRGNPSAYQA